MFGKLHAWAVKNTINILIFLILVSAAITVYNLVDVVRKPASINIIEGSIQHRLVWSAKGECFFVRPFSNETVYLIRVNDCDKGNK
jgi:hypothetical protein